MVLQQHPAECLLRERLDPWSLYLFHSAFQRIPIASIFEWLLQKNDGRQRSLKAE